MDGKIYFSGFLWWRKVFPMRWIASIAMIGGVSLLSTGPLMVRLSGLDSGAATFWRMVLGVVPLVAILPLLPKSPMKFLLGNGIAPILIAGICYGSGMLLFNASALRTSLGNCALLGNLSGLMLAAWGVLKSREWPSKRVALALLLALCGLSALLLPSASFTVGIGVGDCLAFLAAVLFALYFVAISWVGTSRHPIRIHAAATAVGACVVMPFALGSELFPSSWGPVLVLALAQSLGQGLVVFGIGRISTVASAAVIMTFPMFNMLVGAIAYSEYMSPIEMSGAAALLISLVLLQNQRGPRGIAHQD